MLRLVLVLLAACLPAFAGAEAGKPPALLLIEGLYGLKSPADGSKRAHIHADFLRAIGADTGAPAKVIGHLRTQFDAAFAAEKVSRITPANKYRTYAVSLEVLRADQYRVDRPDGTVDVYLPVAVRLYVTSLLSGEVLYSRTLTSYRNRREAREALDSGEAAVRIDADYVANLESLIDQVIAEARQQFRPFQVSATVVDRPLGLFVVDRGLDAGIGKGTELVNAQGAGIRILHTGKGYAVGEATLGDIAEGEVLAMYSTAAAGDIVKPRAMVLDADAPADLPGGYAAVQFAENLGSRAAFAVVAVNPDFQDVLQQIAAADGVQQAEVTQKRVLPDYFVRLRLPEPVVYSLPTSRSFARLRVLAGTAFAELVDRQGRVLYVSRASEQIEDEILEGGIAFDSADRRKVLYGNLLKTLSEQFIRDVAFRQDSLTVTAVEAKSARVADPLNALAIGQDLRLFRPLEVKQVAGPVLLPVWDMTVAAAGGGEARLDAQLPVTPREERLRKGDLGLLQVSGAGGGQSLSASLCPTEQDKGAVAIRELRPLAYFAFGSGSPLPYFGGDTRLSFSFPALAQVRDRLQNAGFARPLQVEAPATPLCYEPLAKVDELSRRCDEASKRCDVELQVIGGVNLLRDGKSVGRKVLVAKSQFRDIPQADSVPFIETQAVQKLYPLLVDSVRQLALPAADAPIPTTAQGN